jgi:DNA-binding beta-propeller fold protein YncE
MRTRSYLRTAWCAVTLGLLLAFAGCSKMYTQAQVAKAEAPPPPPLQYVDAWGMKGSEAGHLDQPTSIAVDALGNIFISDAGSHFVHKFDPQGTPLLSFQDDWIKLPTAITVDRGGGIYTADPARDAVSIFFPGGDRYRDFRLKTRTNSEDELGVAVGDDGMVFVLDNNAGEVLAYTSGFRLVRSWRPFASGRASAIACGSDGYVYVLNAAESRIARFTHDGHEVSEISARPAGANRRLGDEFAVSDGYVFLMDGDGLTLHIFTSDGKPKLDADLSPQLNVANRFVPHLAVSPRHELFVLDAPDSRVLRYRLNF